MMFGSSTRMLAIVDRSAATCLANCWLPAGDEAVPL
ncbi:Uncharacterised protein [Mycobacteroides abscessus subsp. abscessus]|nr:Uncharacterised protein [Mycobacteroides abscessus subsp. abscessus]SKW22709.1 Uncharacterised protein [Mycobacteroides abscessus subsp. abscessus]